MLKVEIEISEEDAKIIKEFLKIDDVAGFLSTLIRQFAQVFKEAKIAVNAGVTFTPEDMQKLGMDTAAQVLESCRKGVHE